MLPLTTFHYFGGLLWEAFRRGQLISYRVSFDDLSLLWGLLYEAFRRGQLLSCLVTGLLLMTFYYHLRGVSLASLPSGTAA